MGGAALPVARGATRSRARHCAEHPAWDRGASTVNPRAALLLLAVVLLIAALFGV
jgi:hypothetical protein